MQEFVLGSGFTAASLGLITLVFFIALARLGSQLRYVRDLTDYLGYDLVAQAGPDQCTYATPGGASTTVHVDGDAAQQVPARITRWPCFGPRSFTCGMT